MCLKSLANLAKEIGEGLKQKGFHILKPFQILINSVLLCFEASLVYLIAIN